MRRSEPVDPEALLEAIHQHVQRLLAVEHDPPPLAGMALGARMQPVYLHRWLLVGMELAQGGHGQRQRRLGADHLQPDFLHPLQRAGPPDLRRGALGAEEGAGSAQLERAQLVLADPPRADRGERLAKSVDDLRRTEGHELVLLGSGQVRDGLDRAHVTRPEALGDPVVDAAGGGVECRVWRVHRDPVARRFECEALLRRLIGQAGHWLEDGRVVRDDEAGLRFHCLGKHGRGEIDRE